MDLEYQRNTNDLVAMNIMFDIDTNVNCEIIIYE